MKVTERALITGGCGFIGSHLADLILDMGMQVTVLDNLSTGRMENLNHQKSNPNLQIIQADITHYNQIEPYFTNIKYVFHLAALADIVPSIERPLDYHNANVNGTLNVLLAAKKNNIKKLIYTASSSCYGIPEHLPTPETADIKPQYPYALTKYIGEQYAMHWGKVYQLPVISLRLFNVYGPRSRTSGTYGAVFGVFLKQKLAGKPFTIVGTGRQTRDFTFVTDVARAFWSAATSNISKNVFNVGSGGTYSINQLTELLSGDRVYIPKRPGEPDCTFADITKIKKVLDWHPKITFEQGVKNVLKNIEYWREAPLWNKESIARATQTWFKYLDQKERQ